MMKWIVWSADNRLSACQESEKKSQAIEWTGHFLSHLNDLRRESELKMEKNDDGAHPESLMYTSDTYYKSNFILSRKGSKEPKMIE